MLHQSSWPLLPPPPPPNCRGLARVYCAILILAHLHMCSFICYTRWCPVINTTAVGLFIIASIIISRGCWPCFLLPNGNYSILGHGCFHTWHSADDFLSCGHLIQLRREHFTISTYGMPCRMDAVSSCSITGCLNSFPLTCRTISDLGVKFCAVIWWELAANQNIHPYSAL
jgi:hypothetical protein